MKLKHNPFCGSLAMTVGEATTVTRTQAQGFSDTSIGIRDSAFVANPGEEKGGRNVNKIIVNVDILMSGTTVQTSLTLTPRSPSQ